MDTAFCHRMEEKEPIASLTENESSVQHFSFLMSLISQKHTTEKRKGNDTEEICVGSEIKKPVCGLCQVFWQEYLYYFKKNSTELAGFQERFVP